MSNKQNQPSTKMTLANLVAVFADGTVVMLDLSKVTIVEKSSNKPLFKEK